MQQFRIMSAGWQPWFVRDLLTPLGARTGMQFVHGLVGDAEHLPAVRAKYPAETWFSISKPAGEPLPSPDLRLLASLEAVGVPTIRSMVRGDQVLRHRSEEEALGYATLLARNLSDRMKELKPDLVLGSFDSIHSALSLAVARSLGIPWVALAFTVIPDNLTWFCNAMTPEQLVPLRRTVDDTIRQEAREVLKAFRASKVRIMAYRPPQSLRQWMRQGGSYARNFWSRVAGATPIGVDRFTHPTVGERLSDLARRSRNRLRLPTGRMITRPPETPFVIFPLHMAPESSVDTWAPMYQNQLELAAQLSLAVPADLEVVVKLHFSDPDNYSPEQLQRLMQLPRVRVAHPGASSRAMIERATLVVGIQGTASMEAALLGKPVLLFGDSPYQHFPRSERARRPDELHEQMRRMLRAPAPSDDEIVEAFASYIARYMPGRINDWNIPIQDAELERLAACFNRLRSHIEVRGNREAWYRQAPFVENGTGSAGPTDRSLLTASL